MNLSKPVALAFALVLAIPISSAAQIPKYDIATPASSSGCTIQPRPTGNVSPLAGKIGGTRDELQALLGEPYAEGIFAGYQLKSCATLYINYFEGTIVSDIMMQSPREDWIVDWDPEIISEGDWTMEQAENVVRSFLPEDIELGTRFEDDRGWFSTVGYSKSLNDGVPKAAYDSADDTPTYGGFTYNLGLTDTGAVSGIMIELLVDDEHQLTR